ncbi:hypothetical protein K488DRAFT_89421 [Vararia minispora EC-137]|uniref:Uncharacterized protein n=1 Tax=Vararia minispora EC-137 TaxID=1314806 RepID=A0ACB8QA98_9AGAM|nr:hypothetical protein K488DRAFT_89421 [Vararia minispora EC-137]
MQLTYTTHDTEGTDLVDGQHLQLYRVTTSTSRHKTKIFKLVGAPSSASVPFAVLVDEARGAQCVRSHNRSLGIIGKTAHKAYLDIDDSVVGDLDDIVVSVGRSARNPVTIFYASIFLPPSTFPRIPSPSPPPSSSETTSHPSFFDTLMTSSDAQQRKTV